MAYTKICGIYCIRNIINGKVYIGSSNNIRHRLNQHQRSLQQNIHCNIYLQRSWNKYGEKSFEFQILIVCDEIDKADTEQKYIELFKCYNRNYGYNLERYVTKEGCIRSVKTREKISKAKKGKPLSDKQIRGIKNSENGWGKNMSKKTHCPKGHPYSGNNLRIKKTRSGYCRLCVTCTREKNRLYKIKKNPSIKPINVNKSFCCRGHAFDEENTYFIGMRQCCKTCKKNREKV